MYKQYFYFILIAFILYGLPINTNAFTNDSLGKNNNNIPQFAINTDVDENTSIETTETHYNLTLDEAVAIQENAGAPPITSLYSDTSAYVQKKAMRLVQPVRLNGVMIDIKNEPRVDSEVAYQFLGSTPVYIKDYIIGDMYNNSNLWYEIAYETESYYIHSSSIFLLQVEASKETNVFEHPDPEAHVFGQIDKGRILTVIDVQQDWYKVGYNYWRIPKKEDIRFYLDPNNIDSFQHLRLDTIANVSSNQLDKILVGKGVLEGLGFAFLEGAKTYQVNEAYLISHSLLETGNGTSPLATGVEVGENEDGDIVIVSDVNRENIKNIKTTYNMYGIGAADSCPVECGAKTAYEHGWFSPEDAIIKGAEWVGKDYIYNEFKQNTLYKMKWNPSMKEGYEWKQYATDIGWAEKQTTNIKAIYDQLDNPDITFDYPIYNE